MCDKMYTYLETQSNYDKYFAFASSLKAFATANQCHFRKETHVTERDNSPNGHFAEWDISPKNNKTLISFLILQQNTYNDT